jgi:hypothetical protein
MDLPPPNLSGGNEPHFSPKVELKPKPEPLPAIESVVEVDNEPKPSLAMEALAYPWRDSGWVTLVPSSLFVTVVLIVLGYGTLGILMLALMCAYFVRITETTISGRNRLPDPLEIMDVLGESPLPLIVFALANWIPIGLNVGTLLLDGATSSWTQLLVSVAAWLLLDAIAAVAVLRYIMIGNLTALAPHRLLMNLMKAGPELHRLIGWRAALMLGFGFSAILLEELSWLAIPLATFVWFYGQVVQARMLGSFYLRVEHQMDF